jgi:hypothetical protein
MMGKRSIAVTAGAALMLAAMSGLALAQGVGGHRGGNHQLFVLAAAAGLSHSAIWSTFKNDTTLATDRANLKTANQAMISCLASPTVSSGGCSSQIQAYSTALGALAQERMTDWQNVMKTAPNLGQAATVYSQLQQLQAQRKQIMQSVFGTSSSTSSSSSSE